MRITANRRNAVALIFMLSGLVLVVGLAALTLGGANLSLSEVWSGVQGRESAFKAAVIVREIRLPRIILAMLVGAALSTSGTVLQALLRNPLADPYVLGISSGAALGTVLALWAGGRAAAAAPLAAFLGALVTMAWVYLLGQRGGRLASTTLLLAGVITASFLSAVILFVLTVLSTRDVRGTAFWLMGDLSTSTPTPLKYLGPIVVVSVALLYAFANDLNILLLGEAEAAHLGVNLPRIEALAYVTASLLTAAAVSVSGAIGYLGLLVPHLGRMLVGNDHRLLLPTAALGGAVVLVVSDTLARTVIAPAELPVGAVTAVAGAPVFIYLLRRTGT